MSVLWPTFRLLLGWEGDSIRSVVYIVYAFLTVSGDGHLAPVPGLVPSKVICPALSGDNLYTSSLAAPAPW